jgi:hypothetical protein
MLNTKKMRKIPSPAPNGPACSILAQAFAKSNFQEILEMADFSGLA